MHKNNARVAVHENAASPLHYQLACRPVLLHQGSSDFPAQMDVPIRKASSVGRYREASLETYQ